MPDTTADNLAGEGAQKAALSRIHSTRRQGVAVNADADAAPNGCGLHRTAAVLATFPFMDVAMSGWDYGGDFDFTLEFTEVTVIIGAVAATTLPFVWWTIDEVLAARQCPQIVHERL